MDLFLSLLPAFLMIGLVILTQKVILSITAGIILGSLISHDYNVVASAKYVGTTVWGILTDFSWYMPIVGFLLLLGVITAYLTISGSTRAFADWAVSKIKNKKSAQLLAWVLGIVIFIDDYFNALVIGEISKPITDRYKISRAKLSYIIDSTSAPVVILLPISTWGAYVIGILSGVFKKIGFETYSGTTAFWHMIPMQFYAIIALIMVFLVIKFDVNIFKMKLYETKSMEGNDISCSLSNEDISNIKAETEHGTKWGLIVSIVSLIVLILGGMLYAANWNVHEMLSVDITLPLFRASVIVTFISLFFVIATKEIPANKIAKATVKGIYSMVPASVILICAWTLVSVIGELETGKYLAEYIKNANLNPSFLPPILFIVGSFIAFMTGTSWGTFGLLLPIAGDILISSEPTMMLPAMAAVLSGAILGDHCSPISDTTVLSATGAQSKLDAHFTSQLPYAVISGFMAFVGFIVYGFTRSLPISYLAILAEIILFIVVVKKRK